MRGRLRSLWAQRAQTEMPRPHAAGRQPHEPTAMRARVREGPAGLPPAARAAHRAVSRRAAYIGWSSGAALSTTRSPWASAVTAGSRARIAGRGDKAGRSDRGPAGGGRTTKARQKGENKWRDQSIAWIGVRPRNGGTTFATVCCLNCRTQTNKSIADQRPWSWIATAARNLLWVMLRTEVPSEAAGTSGDRLCPAAELARRADATQAATAPQAQAGRYPPWH